ncbi:TetR/AcrR family transcriptional regulator C-terminal domain-containing protein [Frankia sp. Cr1]|uniref:TetR/AcrR family transcriptional regulator C-terminal domain-containing protein n=1 Tax=Frankia sp. Cr1 TaxID=3073931 RepID=UPI002AD47330|nr:TetR/AcrR family transcriptional regulator C-terminal domain-containing protein [Frankia sp. Cr1]
MAKSNRAGTRQPLSRERIIDAAVRLVDRDGVDALSMRRLAGVLGVEAMSLYNHVPNKAAVLDGVTTVILDEIDIPPATIGPWEDRVHAIADEFRRVALAHPAAFILLATRPVRSKVAIRAFETGVALLAGAGFDKATSVHAIRAIVALHTGALLREFAGGGSSLVERSQSPEVRARQIEELQAGGFPALAAAVPDLATCDHDEEYRFGMEILLAGLRQRLGR